MFRKGSRYEEARSFAPAEGETEAFPGVRPREIGPATGVIEHTVRSGDRLDLMARHYYDDARLWWRILDANPEILYAGDAVRDEGEGTEAGSEPEVLESSSMVGRTLVIPRGRK